VHRGRQGRSHFLDGGWRAVEAIAWDWRTGFICARFRIEAIQVRALAPLHGALRERKHRPRHPSSSSRPRTVS
jgi:hypothetical protein